MGIASKTERYQDPPPGPKAAGQDGAERLRHSRRWSPDRARDLGQLVGQTSHNRSVARSPAVEIRRLAAREDATAAYPRENSLEAECFETRRRGQTDRGQEGRPNRLRLAEMTVYVLLRCPVVRQLLSVGWVESWSAQPMGQETQDVLSSPLETQAEARATLPYARTGLRAEQLVALTLIRTGSPVVPTWLPRVVWATWSSTFRWPAGSMLAPNHHPIARAAYRRSPVPH